MAAVICAKVVLSTGKVVVLRELKISDTEIAAQEVAPRANGDSNLLQVFMQKVLLKNILVSIDGKPLTATEREDMDSLFKMGEYSQLMKVIAEMSGGDDLLKKPRIEVVSSGDK